MLQICIIITVVFLSVTSIICAITVTIIVILPPPVSKYKINGSYLTTIRGVRIRSWSKDIHNRRLHYSLRSFRGTDLWGYILDIKNVLRATAVLPYDSRYILRFRRGVTVCARHFTFQTVLLFVHLHAHPIGRSLSYLPL